MTAAGADIAINRHIDNRDQKRLASRNSVGRRYEWEWASCLEEQRRAT